jgi:hypothetical protein
MMVALPAVLELTKKSRPGLQPQPELMMVAFAAELKLSKSMPDILLLMIALPALLALLKNMLLPPRLLMVALPAVLEFAKKSRLGLQPQPVLMMVDLPPS